MTRAWFSKALLGWILVGCSACESAQRGSSELARFEFEAEGMGTLFRIVLYAPDARVADAAADAAFARLGELDARLSDYDLESELSRVSQQSDLEVPTPWIPVSRDLARVLARADQISAASDGAFDVTCGQATKLWRRAIREGELPTAEALEQARASIDWGGVEVSSELDRVRLVRLGVRLDLGGVAKGYALDEMLSVLAEHGVRAALVDGGGDVAVSDAPPGAAGWRVELSAVTQDQAPARRTLILSHAAVATSGDLYRSVQIGGLRYSHIVDPATALGLTTQCGASVVASDGMTADALATAATVLGIRGSERLWKGFEDCAFRVVARTEHGLEVS
ncbi:MAG: FAD:protein FMN transferase, partial [Planctomycetota bacterium]